MKMTLGETNISPSRHSVQFIELIQAIDNPSLYMKLQSLAWAKYVSGIHDLGLEVDALGGAPGVYSARYANIEDADYNDPLVGADHDSQANMRKLLYKLDGKENRKARFRTSIALIYKGKEYFFDGIINGSILTEKHGTEGFGYDPVFQPEGYDKSFAELGGGIKNRISHRALATEKLAGFLLK